MGADSRLGPWKVGELSKLTGITVRTLHHYDEIGLLTPSQHTESGHRLYTASDMMRLQQIVSLRHLGFSLEQVKQALYEPGFSALKTIKDLCNEIRMRRIELSELEGRLERIASLLHNGQEVSTQQLIETIERITMYEKYLTSEQLQKVAQIEREMTPKRVEAMTKVEWPQLIAETQAELDKGTDPTSPKVRALAARWAKLVDEKTAGDEELGKRYRKIIDNEPSFGQEFMTNMGFPNGSLPQLLDYIRQAF